MFSSQEGYPQSINRNDFDLMGVYFKELQKLYLMNCMGLIKVEMRQKKPDYLFFLKHFIQNHLFIPIQQETNVPFAQPNLTTEKKRFFIKG